MPGTDWNYSTFAYNLLGVVLEYATGVDFADWVDLTVIEPLGLETLEVDYHWDNHPYEWVGYDVDTDGDVLVSGDNDISWKAPGGGYRSTAQDLARYCAGLMGEELLAQTTKDMAFQAQTIEGQVFGWGLGFDVGTRNGNARVRHNGEGEKARTDLILYPDDELCIVVISNTRFADPLVIAEGVEDLVRARVGPIGQGEPDYQQVVRHGIPEGELPARVRRDHHGRVLPAGRRRRVRGRGPRLLRRDLQPRRRRTCLDRVPRLRRRRVPGRWSTRRLPTTIASRSSTATRAATSCATPGCWCRNRGRRGAPTTASAVATHQASFDALVAQGYRPSTSRSRSCRQDLGHRAVRPAGGRQLGGEAGLSSAEYQTLSTATPPRASSRST